MVSVIVAINQIFDWLDVQSSASALNSIRMIELYLYGPPRKQDNGFILAKLDSP